MAFFDKVKGFLNVGGVSLKIMKVESPFPRGDSLMTGKYVLSTKSDRTILSATAKVVMKTTSGSGQERKTREETVGKYTGSARSEDEYPFELKTGETREFDIFIPHVEIPPLPTGAVGKVMGFLDKLPGVQADKVEFFVTVGVDVKGTPFDPSDTVAIQVV